MSRLGVDDATLEAVKTAYKLVFRQQLKLKDAVDRIRKDLSQYDAVVHLAGANIAGARWSTAQRRAILESRVAGTSVLARCTAKPR